MTFNKVDPKQNFPELEDKITQFWKENNIFEKQVNSRPEEDKYVFYDGPPFITGLPHYGHLLGSISKDIIPRYHAMKGKRVERVWGWDCHGLPIENKVEKKLNLKNRRDIEELGIDKFVEHCYAYTREVSSEWDWYVDKIGRWADMDRAYKTMDQDYMETVMWVFKELYKKDLIYEGVRTSLYCTRCGTPVSNFEIAMDNSYTDMEDPGITAKFKLTSLPSLPNGGKLSQDSKEMSDVPTYMLAWTTTPWTLPSNRALVVEAEGNYVQVRKKIEVKNRKGAMAFIYNPKKDEYLTLVWKEDKPLGLHTIVKGGTEDGETSEETILREITEETGYTDLKVVKKIGDYNYQSFNREPGSENILRNKNYDVYLVELASGKQQKITSKAYERYELAWSSPENFFNLLVRKPEIELGEVVKKHYAGEDIKEVSAQGTHVSDEGYTEDVILGKDRLEETLVNTEYEVIKEFKGKELVGLSYEPLYDFFEPNDKDWKVYSYDGMVSADEGVGIVHSAPGFGEIDTQMGKEVGLTIMLTINDEGKFIKSAGEYAGMFYKDANKHIVENLKDRNLVFDYEAIVHRFPFCYRCETPLMQKAQSSWFINVQKIKKNLIKNNEEINWVPEHIKEGRFKKGLETAPDWGISRSRYWGTPMPVWQAKDSEGEIIERVIIGSRDELMARNSDITKIIFIRKSESQNILDNTDTTQIIEDSGEMKWSEVYEQNRGKTVVILTDAETIASYRAEFEGGDYDGYMRGMISEGETFTTYMYNGKLLDLHRPVIDNIVLKGDKVDELHRVEETLDVWMESASMPYAQKHYPFENKEDVESNFPADYISEYIAQTRAWFYVMHVVSTALFDSNSFKNCVVSGVIMGDDGRKMSKSFGNYPDPKGVLEKYGGDALRMYLLSTSLLKGENVDISEDAIRGQLRDFTLPVWNVFSFFETYANIHNWTPSTTPVASANLLDKWIVARFEELLGSVNTRLQKYDIPGATKELPEFIRDLSKWYVRRSRDRFRNGDKEALSTLYYILVEFAKLIAPFTPFLAEELYQQLVVNVSENSNTLESVHLDFIRDADEQSLEDNKGLLESMKLVRTVTGLGQSLRADNGLKVRQPLAEIFINKDLDDWMQEIITEELNIKTILVDEKQEEENYFSAEDTTLELKVTINANLTKELKDEGFVRELVRNVQKMRKRQGLQLGEEVQIKIWSESEETRTVLEEYATEIKDSINASELTFEECEGEDVKVSGEVMRVLV